MEAKVVINRSLSGGLPNIRLSMTTEE